MEVELRGGSGIFYGPTISNSIGDQAALGFSSSASFVVPEATTRSAFLLQNWSYHRDLDWGRSASDVPNHFVLTVLYEVQPFGGNRYLNAALAHWRVGVLETPQSGPPFTVITLANTTNAFPAGPLRPNLVGDPELPSDHRTLARWFNTSAFVNPANFTFGNSPRSVLRGPGIVTTDLTLEKTIGLPAGKTFDVRVEAYTLLNRTNFNIPGFTLGAADFGVISSARPARTVQLGARFGF